MTTPPSPPPTTPEARRESAWRRSARLQIGLMISFPTLLIIFVLVYGLISNRLFDVHWKELSSVGAQDIAVELMRMHMIAMLVLTGAAAIVGGLVAFTILRPIRALSRAATEMVAKGEFPQRVPAPTTTGELGDLWRSFDSMVDFLNRSIQDRNRLLMEGIATGLMTVDREGRITALNTAAEQLLGMQTGEVVGKSIEELRADRIFSLSARGSQLATIRNELWDLIGESLKGNGARPPQEVVLSSRSGDASLIVEISGLSEAREKEAGLMLNFRDGAQVRRLSEQLSQTDRLAALGTFTMGLAHELRNPLGAIKGMVQLIQMRGKSPAPEERNTEILTRIVREVDRLDSFVAELMGFAHPSPTPPKNTDLNRVLQAAREQVSSETELSAEKEIELTETLAEIPPIRVEPERLVRAFANIIQNAYEAMPSGARLDLETRVTGEEGDRRIEVRIHNTGSTISAESRPHIFDPFYSTKEHGSGLGLAIAYQIVIQNGGTLDVAVGPDDVIFIARFPCDIVAAQRVTPVGNA